ncbi:MAG TPA: chromosome segregation protein SMC [Gemmatimonadaceae bacterium]|nr:chromosome segregation protein SMC [Gemmatimonadaceae bacterium]
MRLTKLEIHGFKSFADSTDLVFESGVTAIVGPNGCGKSNVSDAVRWVLGEQRARLLRGSKMDEVIFQGSSARRPVNLAEVSLHFENADGSLPIPFQEVVITRRLSRSGESEYFLNRAPCRLRDIADMLRGTGLGADTGVVIEAKMIDALLSDRPDDRRELFEEAAGVGLYRDRRRTTERRLEETTVDLTRLDDLVNEVQSQVRSLSRQRKRAERYSELMARRYIVEIGLARREMHSWAEELRRLDERVAQLREQVPQLEEAVVAAEQARDAAHGNRAAADASRNELAKLVMSQRADVQSIRSEMAVAEERQRNTVARRQRAESEASEGEAIGTRIASDRAQAAAERQEHEAQLAAAREELARHVATEETTRAAVTEARTALDSATSRMRALQERLNKAELDRERSHREREELVQRLLQLEEDRVALVDTVSMVGREHDSAVAAGETAKTEAARAAAALDEARGADRRIREEESIARAELFRADEAHTSLTGKVNALEALERERVGLAPAAARLLRDRDRFGEGAVLGPLSDFLGADQDTALLVERFLGATVHAVLIRDHAVADKVRAWHAEANPGPLLLLPLDSLQVSGNGNADETLASHVQAAAPAAGWARALLGGARTVEGGSAFIDSRGAIWLPGATAGPGPLRRRAELFELRSELSASEQRRRTALEKADALRVEVEASELRTREASENLEAANGAVRRAAEQLAEIERRRQRAEREVAEADTLRDRLTARRDELSLHLEKVDAEAQQAAEELRAHEASLEIAREKLMAGERAQEEARELRTRAQVEEAQVQARVQVAADRERRLAEEAGSAVQRLDVLRAELSELAKADSVLAEQMASWQMDLETREAGLRDGEARLADAEAAVKASDEAMTAAEHALDAARRRAQSGSDDLHHDELRHTELGGRRAAIRERLEAEWRKPLDEMLAAVEESDVPEETLRDEAEQLRNQLESLGPVNVLAIEEHDEALKRLDFLTAQRTDLADGKQALQQAIREIDATARELFFTTFNQVRENFRQIFLTLFGGGECDLRLENPEAPMDCDIEIHASPRGKRTQRIHLLSSGERALVALSLLFGIFLTKPSPFCLLDEVDAPLDDANIGRFVKMLNQFKARTQFIVITHNPRTTTEAADAVYGVTMQEPGVSSLVSVRVRGDTVDGAA